MKKLYEQANFLPCFTIFHNEDELFSTLHCQYSWGGEGGGGVKRNIVKTFVERQSELKRISTKERDSKILRCMSQRNANLQELIFFLQEPYFYMANSGKL